MYVFDVAKIRLLYISIRPTILFGKALPFVFHGFLSVMSVYYVCMYVCLRVASPPQVLRTRG